MEHVRIMAVSRELVLGPMPEHAVPESHIASGPWCFSGREEAFPGWDGSPCSGSKPFPLPPDPYASGKAVAEAARAANAEALRLARLTGPLVFADIGSGPLSSRFHDLALGPYMLLVVHMLAERQKRAEDLVGIYGNESLRVALLPPDRHFAFRNCEDFKKNGVHDATFNHYVYSRILEAIAPSNWELYYTNIMPESGG